MQITTQFDLPKNTSLTPSLPLNPYFQKNIPPAQFLILPPKTSKPTALPLNPYFQKNIPPAQFLILYPEMASKPTALSEREWTKKDIPPTQFPILPPETASEPMALSERECQKDIPPVQFPILSPEMASEPMAPSERELPQEDIPLAPFPIFSPETTSKPKTLSEREWTQKDMDRLVDIIVRIFPEGMNIKWPYVHKEFDDPLVSEKTLQKHYASYVRYSKQVKKRRCVQTVDDIVKELYGENVDHSVVEWGKINALFQKRNGCVFNLPTRNLRNNYQTYHKKGPDGCYIPSYPKEIRRIPKVNTTTAPINLIPYWNKEREALLLTIANSATNLDGSIHWEKVEREFNLKIIVDGKSPYLDIDELVKKYEELKPPFEHDPEIHISKKPRIETDLVWTEDLKDQLVESVVTEFERRGKILWRVVEWGFYNRCKHIKNFPFISGDDLMIIYAEICKQRNLCPLEAPRKSRVKKTI